MATITFPDVPNTDDRALHTYLTDMQVLLKKNLETLSGPSIEEVNSRISSSVSSAIPRGVIVAWSGAIIDIPAGWALCNGENDTPDFRDKFIIAAGGSYAVATTGGSSSITTTGTISGTAITTAQMPSHSHSITIGSTGGTAGSAGSYINVAGSGSGASLYLGTNTNAGSTSIGSNGSGSTHTHSLTMNSTSILPPYYALAWIMKL